MSALFLALAGKASTYFAGAAIIIGAFVATYIKGRLSGAKRERDKQAAQEAAAIDAANEIQEDIGALPPEVARKRLGEWSRG